MIVALAGRRIDANDAERPVFPLALADSVKAKLIDALRYANATHIVSSGACGSDLLAMQAAETLQIPKTMILPFKAETFKSTSVTDRPGDWGPIFDYLVAELKQSEHLIELDFDKDDPDVYTKTNFHILDEAEKLSSKNNHEKNSAGKLMAMIIWEGKPKSSGDATHHFMQEAQKRNFIIKEIRINE
ncbi:MAG TPA: hypothetical protein VKA49_13905 [Flavitalea sp.]|nr:hypothetical protein [Flavitalea sp.]